MKAMTIRPLSIRDAKDVWELRRCPKVLENTMTIPSVRLEDVEKKLQNMGPNAHIYVAEVDNKVVGMVGIHVGQGPKRRHTADLGIMVHDDHQGQGIGKQLMEAALDLADNWLNLKRVELGVFTDNEIAIAMYKKYNFVTEGTKKCVYFSNGAYKDEFIMARYNIKEAL
ncbi:GNAT family N-acetyltransferase [Vallitalea okinawensis]|uniref:GNAT family N-acetyltransferase n=1 Tax=Vallitalea okinawensis TaxID=2078660 RepID=UPI001FA899E2|nr:GNAT family N-acetyltransferase [Vallitalea okinawensis]